ncbi:MAG: FAD:protein FMN transferase, partial [Clostridiales bacterium]|nr:FAD:protein FMN transferase [Clostridiales bacterium]
MAEISRIEDLVSTGIESSEIAQLNETGTGTVSADTGTLIEYSLDICEDTDGVFDITIYPVMKAWGFTDQNYRVPDDAELEELMGYMGIDKISYDADTGEVSLAEGTEIDLGGIAKGYTSDRVMDILTEYGVESAVISLGGNVEALGTKPDGSLWRVAVENPDDTSDYVGIISVADKAIITSGCYVRYFEEDGITYHLIIDPGTGYPADSGL